jgi:hypothetical protein
MSYGTLIGWISSLLALALVGVWIGNSAGNRTFESVDYTAVKLQREPLGVEEINRLLPAIQSDISALNLRLITNEGRIIDIEAHIARINIQAEEDRDAR